MSNIKSSKKLEHELTVEGEKGWDVLIQDVKKRIRELQSSLESFERCKQAGVRVKAHLLRPKAIERLEAGTGRLSPFPLGWASELSCVWRVPSVFLWPE
jgi:hypothetical protein